MPFEMMPRPDRSKMTIDVYNANWLLDIYMQFNQILSNLNVLISNATHWQYMSGEDIEKIYTVESNVSTMSIEFTKIVIDYIDKKGIRDIMEKERFVPDDI